MGTDVYGYLMYKVIWCLVSIEAQYHLGCAIQLGPQCVQPDRFVQTKLAVRLRIRELF